MSLISSSGSNISGCQFSGNEISVPLTVHVTCKVTDCYARLKIVSVKKCTYSLQEKVKSFHKSRDN